MKQRQWKREKFSHNSFRGCDATWTDHIQTYSWMRHKAGHSWGWQDWWGWVSNRRPFKLILPGTHSMSPKSPGSTESSYTKNMHGKPREWYIMWSRKVSKRHLISHLLMLCIAIPATLLTISPLGESAPFTPCFIQVANCREHERESGEPMRD